MCVWATDTTSGRARWIGAWMQNAAGLIVGVAVGGTVPSGPTSTRSATVACPNATPVLQQPERLGVLGVAGADVTRAVVAPAVAAEDAVAGDDVVLPAQPFGGDVGHGGNGSHAADPTSSANSASER